MRRYEVFSVRPTKTIGNIAWKPSYHCDKTSYHGDSPENSLVTFLPEGIMEIIFGTRVPCNWWHKLLAYKFLAVTVTEKWLFITLPSDVI